MVRLFVTLLFLGFSVSAKADLNLKSVWAADEEVEGKQYLAVFSSDEYHSADYVLIYGNGADDKLKARHFNFGYFYPSEGKVEVSRDDFYTISITSIKKDQKIKVEFEGRTPGYDLELDYNVIASQYAKNLGLRAARTFQEKFAALEEVKNPKSLAQFKEMLQLTAQKFQVYTDDGDSGPFKTFPLQIEATLNLSNPNKTYAQTKIKKDGSDTLSKKFRKAKKWSEETDIPSGEDWSEYFNPETGESTDFSTYSTKASGFVTSPFKKGAARFVKYEIVRWYGMECEGSWFESQDYLWILEDGSVFSYEPALECD